MNNISSPKPNFSQPVQNFLESLRQRSTASKEEVAPSSSSLFEKFQERRRLEEQRKQEFFQSRTREFKEVYSLKKKQQEQEIQALQEKIQQYAKSQKKLDQQIATAIIQAPVTPGDYHKSFYEHLNTVLDLLKRQVDSANTWLYLFNQRNGERSYYWNQASKSGSRFTQSQERQVSTSLG